MGKRRLYAPMVRRFLTTLVVVALASGYAARTWGEQVTTWLDRVPAAASGWQLLGWLFGGPALLAAVMAWNDRARLDVDQRRIRATAYGAWLGVGAFVVPALAGDSYALFGSGVAVGNPLAFGWACGAVGNLAAILFATGIGVLRRRATPVGLPPESELSVRFVEVAWTVLVFGSMLFAAYGRDLGFVY